MRLANSFSPEGLIVRVASKKLPGPTEAVQRLCVAPLLRYLPEKGSVTLAGVSLTISAAADRGFAVALIPVTLEETTLGALAAGDRLNLEVDLVARYLERMIGPRIDEDNA